MRYSEFKTSLIEKATFNNIPVLGEFELTSTCNFKCSMCYVHLLKENNDLDTNTWKSIFKQAANNSLLFATLTGGEALNRFDFNELYEYLFDLGVKITVFTNGSILTKDLLNLFKRKKPHYIAITLYGYDEASYFATTKKKNAFAMVTKNILLLRANNINVLLRTIPLRHLYDNLTKMISYVKSLNSKLFYTSYITKSNCYDKQNDRLDAKQLIDFETQIDQAFNYEKSGRIFEDTYLSCSALRSSYFINNKGFMLPCPLGITPHKSIIDNDFLETFLSLGTEFKNLEKQNPCSGCAFLSTCFTCYARRINEEANNICPPYLRDYAIKKFNSNYYMVAGIALNLDYKYYSFFKNNLEKYQLSNKPSSFYQIKTHYLKSIPLPTRNPDIIYENRLIYQDKTLESIYVVNDDNIVKQAFIRTNDYKTFNIYFNTSLSTDLAEKEYIFTGIAFLDIVAANKAIPIHGSAIKYQNKAIIFSAPSQTGKSTHANFWLKAFNSAEIINDDKPLIYLKDNSIVASGSPWSGKDSFNQNIVSPLSCIVFLKQGLTNEVTLLDTTTKLKYLLKNILRPKEQILWDKMWPVIEKIIVDVPMFLAKVTNDISAAHIVKNKIARYLDEN